MHLIVILIVLAIAWQLRQSSIVKFELQCDRPGQYLFLFLFPPLLLLTTAVAIICMGFHGKMLGFQASWVGYTIAVSFLVVAGCSLLQLIYQGDRSIRQLKQYPQQKIGSQTARIIEVDFPYSAQIGFWHSQLVISRGLLTTLDREHLEAVLAHELAHAYYRDTFWFFWLGWLRHLTFWLPNTELLWQELLLFRELRADCYAAQTVDFLLLAESLLTVAQAPLQSSPLFSASFNDPQLSDRLTTRIDFLLEETKLIPAIDWENCSWVLLLILPLLTILLHYQ
ncbi:MAG: M56 family metallopeptidase [Pleurocapsa sp.]